VTVLVLAEVFPPWKVGGADGCGSWIDGCTTSTFTSLRATPQARPRSTVPPMFLPSACLFRFQPGVCATHGVPSAM
jgi:hypothetical protein